MRSTTTTSFSMPFVISISARVNNWRRKSNGCRKSFAGRPRSDVVTKSGVRKTNGGSPYGRNDDGDRTRDRTRAATAANEADRRKSVIISIVIAIERAASVGMITAMRKRDLVRADSGIGLLGIRSSGVTRLKRGEPC